MNAKYKWFKYFAILCRFIVGIVFTFSGFVKAIDPMGTAYKFEEYFSAFGISWLSDLSLVFSFLLFCSEFIVGSFLMIGLLPKISSWFAFIFMVIFTPLTLYLAIVNPISDCGCFGDAIKMTNWETFYKNIVISIFTLIVFIYRNIYKKWLNVTIRYIVALILIVIPLFVAGYGILFEPIIDFRPWKIGASLKIDLEFQDKYYVTYKNKKTGEMQEFLSPHFPWNDPKWLEEWEFVGQRVEGAPLPETYFLIADELGNDYFKDFTQHEDLQFILIMHNVENANLKKIDQIKHIAQKAKEHNKSFITVTGSTPQKVTEFINNYQINFEIYFSDETTLKTIARTNPALLLIKNGIIIGKWSYNNLPRATPDLFQ